MFLNYKDHSLQSIVINIYGFLCKVSVVWTNFNQNCDISTNCQYKGAPIPEVSLPGQVNLICWCLIFVGSECGTCLMSPLWCLEFWGGSWISGKFVHLCVGEYSRHKLSWKFVSWDVSLTIHLSITLANDQLDAQILLLHLLQSSTCTCFEQYLAHPQEVKLY